MSGPRIIIGLSAVIVAVTEESPFVVVTREPGEPVPGLPFGQFDPAGDRTLELSLRGWVKEQTGFDIGYVEQLYTFGDRGREMPLADIKGAGPDRVISISYLALTPSRNRKIEALSQYFATTPDPDRGYALAILTGALTFKNVKPAILRDVVLAEVDPHLFALSYDYVGDLGETIALIWPHHGGIEPLPSLSDLVELEGMTLGVSGKLGLRRLLLALDDPRIDRAELEKLVERAERQLATLEALRLERGMGALTSSRPARPAST